MGYFVKSLKTKKRQWKIQYQSYKGGGRKTSDIKPSEYLNLGFRPDMGIDAARERCKQLNSQVSILNQQEVRQKINERHRAEDLIIDAFLPRLLTDEFEQNIKGKFISHWRTAKKIITNVKLDQSEWAENASKFYSLMEDGAYSWSYVQKLVYILNQWGKFVSRKSKIYYEKIPLPSGRDKGRIIRKYHEAKGSGASWPLTTQQLENLKDKMKPEHYNWLFLSFYFGLRPSEVDSLKEPSARDTWWIETDGDVKILWVYQTKIEDEVSPEECPKPIPCYLVTQLMGLEIIKSKKFKRPITKTIKKYLGKNYTKYAGRKGFTDLMLEKGYPLEKISIWMGHKSIERTWRNYKNKKKW